MRVNKPSPILWVSWIAAIWICLGFLFAQMKTGFDDPGLEKRVAQALAPDNGRILIVGGSNVIAGVHFGDLAGKLSRPVVDLSIVDEGGDERILWHYAEAVTKSGDTVVLSLRSIVAHDPEDISLASSINGKLKAQLGPRYAPVKLDGAIWRPLPPISLAQKLRAVLLHTETPKTRFTCEEAKGTYDNVPYHSKPELYWSQMAQNIARLRSHGVRVVATLPWLRIPPEQQKGLRRLIQEAREHLAAIDVPVIEPDDDMAVVKDESLSCDGAHLSRKGAEVHTRYLTKYLKAVLDRQP
jgi:hypothetical protein